MSNLSEMMEQIDPEDFLSYIGVDFKNTTGRSGQQLNVKECPRCGGNSWKVFLNSETGLGNCFHGSCVGEPGFNLFSFTKAFLGSGGNASKEMETYCKNLGWRPKKKKRAVQSQTNSSGIILPKSVALPVKGRNAVYLSKRGFTNETTAYFGWRISKNGCFDYKDYEGNAKKQDYSNRIIIPVYDLSGNLCTFQGRDISGTADKKYLFPPGLAGTSKYLYNGQNAIGAKEIVINEGVFDVASVKQAFSEDPNLVDVVPVGTFGKCLSDGNEGGDDQLGSLLKLKESGLRRVTFMWDSEPKALADACKAALTVIGFGFEANIARLPDGCDPNESTPIEVRKAYRRAFKATRVSIARFLAAAKRHR